LQTGKELAGLDQHQTPPLALLSDDEPPPGNHEGHDLRLEY
jgi:hypothetical protein